MYIVSLLASRGEKNTLSSDANVDIYFIYILIMTTQEIANRLVELCRAGEYVMCYDELFSDAVVAV